MSQPRIIWNEQLSVGVAIIDSQHKELIRIANLLLDGVARGDGRDAVDMVVKKLREYTVFHFNSEEGLMEDIRYPDRHVQAREHHRLKKEVKDFQRQLYKKISRDARVRHRVHEVLAPGPHPGPRPGAGQLHQRSSHNRRVG